MEERRQERRLERARKRKQAARRRRILWCCGLAAALVVAYLSLCAVGGRSTIYPNTTAVGVDLSGMTQSEASSVLTDAVAKQASQNDQGIAFTVKTDQGKTIPMEVPLSQVQLNSDAVAEQAFQVGHSAPFPARGGAYLRSLVSGQEILPIYEDCDALDKALEAMDKEAGRIAEENEWALGKKSLTITKGQPGCYLDRDAIKKQVLTYLNEGKIVPLNGKTSQFTVDVHQTFPKELDFDSILKEIGISVRDAKFDPAQKLFQKERTGVSFSVEEAKKLFDSMDWGETADLPLIITKPKVTIQDLSPQFYQDTLGTATSSIGGSNNRVHNIQLAAKLCNGKTLMPGEVFSYNQTVGSRSAGRGFLPAPAYVGGQSVDETGGGVCQGSSTIYLAALNANLAIVERYNHGYITRYVPEGMDATVYYGAKDLRFKNDTPFPIKIQASVSGRSLSVAILGTKSSDITVKMTNKVVDTKAPKTVYKVDPNLPAGSTKVSTTPYNGYTVKVYRNLYKNGTLIDTKLESTNYYKSRDKVILVSPKDADRYHISG